MADSLEKQSSKRPRPVVSCLECRRKKLKCDRTRPCQQCTKARRAEFCSFQPGQEPRVDEDSGSHTTAATTPPPASNGNVSKRPRLDGPGSTQPAAGPDGGPDTLNTRVAYLERLLGVNTSSSGGGGGGGGGGGKDDRPSDSSPSSLHPGPSSRRNILSGIFPHAHAFVQSFLASEPDSRMGKVAQELRSLHDGLKVLHSPPRSVCRRASGAEMREMLPSLQVCQRLTEMYFDNMEHCFRILHRPTFAAQLTDYFGQPSADFLPQLVGVLSIAALLAIDQDCVDVGAVAGGRLVQASVSFIEDYIAGLAYRKRNTIAAFQTRSLLMLLRCMRLDRQSELWELSGSLLRQALVMGMDRDPSERAEACSAFEAELRRRLWMSVVEMDLMMSILCNMPCLTPDFSCRAPKNLDDVELLAPDLDTRASRPFDQWTDGLCQCFLAESLRRRLHGCKDVQSSADLAAYARLLGHTRRLEQVLQQVPAPLRFDNPGDQARLSSARLMARMEVDLTIRRPLMHIYTPFAYANDAHDAFCEARAGFLQSCFMVTSYQDLFDPAFSRLHVDRPAGYWDFFFNVYRHEVNQSILGLCREMQRLARAADGGAAPVSNRSGAGWRGPAYTRASLVHHVAAVLDPMARRIAHAGADLRDLAYLTIVFATCRQASPTDAAIVDSLEALVAACRLHAASSGGSGGGGGGGGSGSGSGSDYSTPGRGFDFDAAWMNIPSLSDDFYFPTTVPFDLEDS